MENTMDKTYGSQSMIAPLRRVLVRRPNEAFGRADPTRWHYTDSPDLVLALREHDAFVSSLLQAGVEVIYHDQALPDHADAVYVHDPALVTESGAIILSMGKGLRRGEEAVMARCFEALGIPILYTVHGPARAEGGDLLWLDEHTLAVGQGFRTNVAGLQQLQEALNGLKVELIPVQLPYYHGPEACLHLMSLISLVDHRTAVVYLPLLPTPFWQYLRERDFRLIEVPEQEFETMGTNVLALAPGQCLMLEGNPVTQRRLEAAGCEVLTYRGNEISLKAEGGPTCLTRPIWREG
jgi:N-dimethylarginine dimethylaminohydrolase